MTAVLTVGSFSGKRCWVPLRSRLLEGVVAPAVWLSSARRPLFSPAFLVLSVHLSCAGLWAPWNGRRSRVVLYKVREAGRRSPGEERFLAGSVLLALSGVGLGDGVMQAKWSFVLPFPIVALKFFCSTLLLKFLKWAPERAQSCLCLWLSDFFFFHFCRELVAEFSYSTILAIALPKMFDVLKAMFGNVWYCDIINEHFFPLANCAQG